MKSLEDKYLDSISFNATQAKTLSTLGEYRGKQKLYESQRPQIVKSLITVAQIESTDASNKIENIYVPERRIKALVKKKTEPKNRSEQEIAGYRDALELIHQAQTDMPITVNTIRQLHQALYRYMPDEGGNWKPVDNDIVEKDNAGVASIRFSPVSAVETPFAMDELITKYHEVSDSKTEPLVVIPLLILDFLCIHPFRDGNGRVSRLLTLLSSYHADFSVGRFISLERVIFESKESYYNALYESSQGWHDGEHNALPWLEYFWGVMLRAYKEFEERVGTLDGKQESKSQRIHNSVLRKIHPFKIVDIERECPDISREYIRKTLGEMKKNGQVELSGRGPGARWHNRGKTS